jgi:hypothetical protein
MLRNLLMLACSLFLLPSIVCGQQQDGGASMVIPYDYSGNGFIDIEDVDILTMSGVLGPDGYVPDIQTEHFDVNMDGRVNQRDVNDLVRMIIVFVETEGGEGEDTQITPETCIPGDLNFDTLVDTLDMDYMEGCYWFATFVPHLWIFKYSNSDCTGDNIMNIEDFEVLRTNWSAGSENYPGHPPGIQ